MDKLNLDQFSDSRIFNDVSGLDRLRKGAQNNEKEALREVAKQFESIFVQMLMKSMRQANAAFESDSPFNSQYTKFYEQMQDQQMAMDLSTGGGFGLAELMVEQLSPESSNMRPASVLRGGEDPFAALAAKQDAPAAVRSEQPAAVDSTAAVDSAQRSGAAIPLRDAKPFDATAAGQVASWSSPDEFISSLLPMAKEAAEKLGTQPEVLLAQSALETGWGQKMVKHADGSPSNNLFNIKADSRWNGGKAEVLTTEYHEGVPLRQKADFRSYDSLADSFNDFVEFLTESPRYQPSLQQSADPASFLHSLQQAGYATDPRYADKILGVLERVKATIESASPIK